ncbi:MAG: hypothetical protein LBQ00_08080 [Syntrophobacterales bacterium]|jgi:hypothetical protein|nr:hypothetical protein [Syntrophobacterales bacterium]
MLPRRHILDVCEFVKNKDDLIPMCTVILAIDAVKHLDPEYKNDHLVGAVELNEFICYLYPILRPRNRSLLMHVVSDVLSLLLYGAPVSTRPSIKNLEIIDYSKKNMEIYPVIEVWNTLKEKVPVKKHDPQAIINGFIQKIRVEMDVLERYPAVENIFDQSKAHLKAWLPCLANYYDKPSKTIKNLYGEWWSLWHCGKEKDKILGAMLDRLSVQAETDYNIALNKDEIFNLIMNDRKSNMAENRLFSLWYKQGVNLLMKI